MNRQPPQFSLFYLGFMGERIFVRGPEGEVLKFKWKWVAKMWAWIHSKPCGLRDQIYLLHPNGNTEALNYDYRGRQNR